MERLKIRIEKMKNQIENEKEKNKKTRACFLSFFFIRILQHVCISYNKDNKKEMLVVECTSLSFSNKNDFCDSWYLFRLHCLVVQC